MGKGQLNLCGHCNANCASNSVFCFLCAIWFHAKCEQISYKDVTVLKKANRGYICSSCADNNYEKSLERITESPCCKKEYTCRLCHDDVENHQLNRQLVQRVKCAKCLLEQKVQKACEKCDTEFGWYFCEKCCLYDDEDKGQFHCEGCGLCRIGGKDKFFHCDKCGICLGMSLKGNHKCVEESSRRNCPICLEDLHTSRMDGHIPPCGHLIHSSCMKQCIKTGNYACPTCNQSLFDMGDVWTQLDEEVANTPMPEEYRNFYVFVLCRDCHKESRVKFHVIGLKCKECGSYNTCRTGAPEDEPKSPTKPTPHNSGAGPGPNHGEDEPPEGAAGGGSGS